MRYKSTGVIRKQVGYVTSDDFAVRATAMTGTLYRVSCTLLDREADREDAVQEAICRAWERRSSLRDPRFFQTWLTRILINACYDVLRDGKRVVYMDELPETPAPDTGPEQSMDLARAVGNLERSLRLPVILYYAEGFSVEEIAGMLGLSVSAAKMRLHRARALLRQRLSEEDEKL